MKQIAPKKIFCDLCSPFGKMGLSSFSLDLDQHFNPLFVYLLYVFPWVYVSVYSPFSESSWMSWIIFSFLKINAFAKPQSKKCSQTDIRQETLTLTYPLSDEQWSLKGWQW